MCCPRAPRDLRRRLLSWWRARRRRQTRKTLARHSEQFLWTTTGVNHMPPHLPRESVRSYACGQLIGGLLATAGSLVATAATNGCLPRTDDGAAMFGFAIRQLRSTPPPHPHTHTAHTHTVHHTHIHGLPHSGSAASRQGPAHSPCGNASPNATSNPSIAPRDWCPLASGKL